MAQNLHITLADSVFNEISNRMKEENKSNRSEFVEELIRAGLAKKKGDSDELDNSKSGS